MEKRRFDFLWQYVEHWSAVDPDYIALRAEDRAYSYGEFSVLTDNIATAFLNLGLKKGDMIASMLPASLEYTMLLVAADKIGAVVTALDVKYKTADLKRFISHIQPKVVLALAESEGFDIAGALTSVEADLSLDTPIQYFMIGQTDLGQPFETLYQGKPERNGELQNSKSNQKLSDGLLVIFTGGTTGVPKAALLSKQNVSAMATIEADILNKILVLQGIDERIKAIACLPPSHVGGTVEMICSSIVSGCEIIIHDSWSPQRVLETVQNEKIVWIGGVPTMYAIMLLLPDLVQYDLSSLKLAVLSGEKVELELLRLIKTKICPSVMIGYGSTEAGSEVTFTELSDSDEKIADGYVGKAIEGVDIRIMGENGEILPDGQLGEVQTSGSLTINNYYKMPAEDLAGLTTDGYCKTGDLGYLTPEGGLYIKGRIKHIIRVGSYTVMPSEVEEVAVQHPSVGMAAAIGVPDKIYGETVWLVVSPTPGSTVDEAQLITFCKKELAKYKVPQRVIVEAELPITRIGKVHRVEVQNRVVQSIKGETNV